MEKKQVIVSLTSFPAAIKYASGAIKSILEGSVLPDKVILYLTFAQFGDEGLPDELHRMERENEIFEIRDYPRDIRSYRKLIPALSDFPDAVIITIDDDVHYSSSMLRDMLELHERYPEAIIANRAKRILPDKPYKKWPKYKWYSFIGRPIQHSYHNLQTGVGGVLYPPHSLKADMLDVDLFTSIAPTTDDIWFWAAGVANGHKILPYPYGKHNKPRGLGKPRELSLKTINFKSGHDGNRAVLQRILEKYPIIKERLENEC